MWLILKEIPVSSGAVAYFRVGRINVICLILKHIPVLPFFFMFSGVSNPFVDSRRHSGFGA